MSNNREVVAQLATGDAERLDRRIRSMVTAVSDSLSKLAELVDEAKRGQIHLALGYPSWTAYVADALKVQVRLERPQRRELVGYLAGEGISQRVIADVVGISKNTVTVDIAQVSQTGTPEDRPMVTDDVVPLCDRQVEKKITGRDGKTYPSPSPSTPRRRPITDAFRDASYDLRKVVERLGRLADDERFDRNLDTLRSKRGHLVRARDELNVIIGRLDGGAHE